MTWDGEYLSLCFPIPGFDTRAQKSKVTLRLCGHCLTSIDLNNYLSSDPLKSLTKFPVAIFTFSVELEQLTNLTSFPAYKCVIDLTHP